MGCGSFKTTGFVEVVFRLEFREVALKLSINASKSSSVEFAGADDFGALYDLKVVVGGEALAEETPFVFPEEEVSDITALKK